MSLPWTFLLLSPSSILARWVSGWRVGDPKIRQGYSNNWVQQHRMRWLCRTVFLPASPLSINSKQQMVPSFPRLLSLKPINPAHGGAGQRAESNQRPTDGLKTNQHSSPFDLRLSRDLSWPSLTPFMYFQCSNYSWILVGVIVEEYCEFKVYITSVFMYFKIYPDYQYGRLWFSKEVLAPFHKVNTVLGAWSRWNF